jgi:hypothetical protein
MKTHFWRCKGLASTAIFVGVLSWAGFDRSAAYVLPAQQLLQFMAVPFSKFDTLVVKQAVERESAEGSKAFEEILSMKSPNFLHAQVPEPSVDQGRMIDRNYLKLFLASTQTRLTVLLAESGVDLEKVSYTRILGTVAYLIGDNSPESPRIALEKKRFLPLLFVYPSRLLPDHDLVEVTFRNYSRVDQGWYPFEILYKSGQGLTEHYNVESIRVNVPLRPSLFNPSQGPSGPAQNPAGEEKIKAIIKSIEKRDGQ